MRTILEAAHEHFKGTPDGRRLVKELAEGIWCPVMNNTKWSELISEMRQAPPAMLPQFRARGIFAREDYVSDWDGEWYYHIQPVLDIEWMELRAKSVEWLIQTLRMLNIPFSVENAVPRVWGYTKTDAQPNWE